MKKEYKKFTSLLYCYNPVTDTTVRVDTRDSELTMFCFKLNDWDEKGEYMKCTKKEFKAAFEIAIKKLIQVTK